MDNSDLNQIHKYLDLGYYVIPIAPNKKTPIQKQWQKRPRMTVSQVNQAWEQKPLLNVGLICGSKSGILVVDVDTKNGKDGLATLAELEKTNGPILTPRVQTPSAGLHLYLQMPDTPIKNKVEVLPGIDVRSNNGYVLAPPSKINGKSYKWLHTGILAPCPDWLLALFTKKAALVTPSPTVGVTVKKGQRNNAIFKFSCGLKKQGIPIEQAKIMVLEQAAKYIPPLDKDETLKTLDSAYSYQNKTSQLLNGIDANELWHTELPEANWLIQNLLPTGLTILAGKPKSGKSWLVYDLALKMATGDILFGKLDVDQGNAILLALEDTKRRLKDRMKTLLIDEPPPPGSLKLHCECSKNGVKELEASIIAMDGVRLVVIDTLARFRSKAKSNSDLYGKDYEDIAQLKALADKYSIAIVVLHHLRKSKADDPFEMINGTGGLTGAADTMMVLEKAHGSTHASLHVRGRDVEEQTLGLAFDNGHWTIDGYYRVPPTKNEAEILHVIGDSKMTSKEVSEATGKKESAAAKALQRMYDKELLERKDGKYCRWEIEL